MEKITTDKIQYFHFSTNNCVQQKKKVKSRLKVGEWSPVDSHNNDNQHPQRTVIHKTFDYLKKPLQSGC